MSSEHVRILRFLGAGLINTGFGYGCYSAFVVAGSPLWLSVGGATTLGFLFNFLSYGGLVFGNVSCRLLPRFLPLYAALGGLNFALVRLLTRLGLGQLLAQAVMLPVLAAAGYLGMRGFVFRGRPQRSAR